MSAPGPAITVNTVSGAGTNLKVEGAHVYIRREAPEKIFISPLQIFGSTIKYNKSFW